MGNENTLTNDFKDEVVASVTKDYSEIRIKFVSGAELRLQATSFGRIDAFGSVIRSVRYDD